MHPILDLTVAGNDLPPGPIHADDVIDVARELEQRLFEQGRNWDDVSLLMLLNSKDVVDPADAGDEDDDGLHEDEIIAQQRESDLNLVEGLRRFCAERKHFPPLLGSTVHGCFYFDRGHEEPEVRDGIVLVAYTSLVLKAIPVAVETSTRKTDRKYAGTYAVQKCLRMLRDEMQKAYGRMPTSADIRRNTTGILFTSGSGHIGAKQFIDFNDCYAVGQELLSEAEGNIVGGCSSNRSEKQFQCIYHSNVDRDEETYAFTYGHSAIVAFLPETPSEYLLQHPYEFADEAPLELEFDTTDQYDDGRYFFIETMNGKAPMEFLVDYWDVSIDDMELMLAQKTPIPAQMKTFEYTIASALSRFDRSVFPNVPIWFRELDGRKLLRLVRAEAEGSPYYLMKMKRNGLRDNVRTLAAHFDQDFAEPAAIVSFLCESRKYLLDAEGSNVEADAMLAAMPDAHVKLGIYLNGEYAIGPAKAVGYHNFTQISAITPMREISELPGSVRDEVERAQARERVAVVLCAIAVEQEAVLAHLDDVEDETHRGTVYASGTLACDGGNWRVHTALIGAGNEGAALEAERAFSHFTPEIALFVGVAGGIKDVELGDVVVSTDIYGYEAGKDKASFQSRNRVARSNHSLVQRAQRERQSDDWYTGADSAPAVLVAPIAAGSKVVASRRSATYKFLREACDQAVAVEMEGIGFLDAAHADQDVKALVVRGISDLCKKKKQSDGDGWQARAAEHASMFAMNILRKI